MTTQTADTIPGARVRFAGATFLPTSSIPFGEGPAALASTVREDQQRADEPLHSMQVIGAQIMGSPAGREECEVQFVLAFDEHDAARFEQSAHGRFGGFTRIPDCLTLFRDLLPDLYVGTEDRAMLAGMPVESTCGEDCAIVIEAAGALVERIRMAHGTLPKGQIMAKRVADIAIDVCTTFIAG